jgi:hypothetical protein
MSSTTLKDTVKEEGKRRLKLREKQQLTLPVFSLAHTPIMTVRVLDEIHEADFVLEIPGKPDSKPLVVTVMNLDTDEKGILVVNAIMKSAFEKCVATDPQKHALTGRYFSLSARGKREDKKYLDINVVEMEPVE